MKTYRALLGLTCLLATGLPAAAYYRGNEHQPRNYTFDPEYFVDLLSIEPRFELVERYLRATNAYLGSAGSYTRRDLFNDQFFKWETPLTPRLRFTFDFEASRDWDASYDHYLIGADYEFRPGWRAGILGQPLARKEYADAGLVLRKRTPNTHMDALLMLPNFSWKNKNDDESHFLTQPVNLQLRLLHDLDAQWTLYADIDHDIPSQTRYELPEYDFSYRSFKPRAGLIWRIDPHTSLRTELFYENTAKERASFPEPTTIERDPRDFAARHPDEQLDFHTSRDFYEGRIEYVRWLGEHRLMLGAAYLHLREKNRFPNNPPRTEHLDHASRILYALWGMPISQNLLFSTGIYQDIVDHRQTFPHDDEHNYRSTTIEGKIPFHIEWASDRFSFTAGLAIQTDQPAFGGGFMNGMVVF